MFALCQFPGRKKDSSVCFSERIMLNPFIVFLPHFSWATKCILICWQRHYALNWGIMGTCRREYVDKRSARKQPASISSGVILMTLCNWRSADGRTATCISRMPYRKLRWINHCIQMPSYMSGVCVKGPKSCMGWIFNLLNGWTRLTPWMI